MTIKFSSDNFTKEAFDTDKTVLVDFWAPWCGPCRMLSPVIEEVAKEVGENVKIGKINIDEEPELAAKYGIMTIPTLLVMKNGNIEKKSVGVIPKKEILKMIH